MPSIYVAGWAGDATFPAPPQIVENRNAFPCNTDETFSVQFDYSWPSHLDGEDLDPQGTARAFARIIWRDRDGNDVQVTEWPLPATSLMLPSGQVVLVIQHVAFEADAPETAVTGVLAFEGPDVGDATTRWGVSMEVTRPDVRRVLITSDSVPGSALLDGAVSTPKIAPGAVVPGKIAPAVISDWHDVSETGFYTAPGGTPNAPFETGFSFAGYAVQTTAGGLLLSVRAGTSTVSTHSVVYTCYRTLAGTWGSWGRAGGLASAAGSVSFPSTPGGGLNSIDVTFPAGRFESTPSVNINASASTRPGLRHTAVTGRSANGFTATYENTGSSASGLSTNWIAMEQG